MTLYVLANDVNLLATIITAGKIVDSNHYDVAALRAAGAILLDYNADTAARASVIRSYKVNRGAPVSYGRDGDSFTPFLPTPLPPAGAVDAVYFVGASSPGALQAVYESSSEAGTAELASAASLSTLPAIGFVVASGGGMVSVRQTGELFGFVALLPGAVYYLSATTPGAITATAPSAQGQVVQKVGYAKDAFTLVIETDADFVQL